MFGNLSSNNAEASVERVSTDFTPLNTGLYKLTIKMAYGIVSKNGALGVTFEFETEDGKTFKEDIYATNKNKENFWIDSNNDNKKVLLPGFTAINNICLITTGKELSVIVPEERVLEVYDYEAGGLVKKPMPVMLDLLNQQIIGAVKHVVEFKSKKVGDKYVQTDETREYNTIDLVFHPEQKITVAEARNGVTEPTLYNEWDSRFTGKTIDKTSGKKGGNKPQPKATGSTFDSGSQGVPSLFGKK